MTSRETGQTTGRWITAALLWLTAFLLLLSTFVLTNDHFDRITRARQAARYGEMPFRDFLDPGYFMTVLSSAGLQRILGDNLLGEFLLNAAFITTGTTIVFWLVARLTRSLPLGILAAAMALLTLPRFYDFDKVLFYSLGVLLCWRYIENPSRPSIMLLGTGIVAGGVFRYDTAIYMSVAALTALTVLHWREWGILGRRFALLAASIAVAALPVLVFVQANGGLANAADQIVTYALRERDRTRISFYPRLSMGRVAAVVPTPPVGQLVRIRFAASVDEIGRRAAARRYSLADERPHGEPENRTWSYRIEDVSRENVHRLIADPLVEDTDGIDRARSALPPEPLWTRLQRSVPLLRVRLLPGSWNAENGSAFLYYLLFALPVGGALALVGVRGDRRVESARVLGLAAMCLVLDVLILRDPISARVGGMAGPSTVMAAWVGWRVWGTRRTVARGVLVVLLAVTVWAIGVTADWPVRLRTDRLTFARMEENLRALAHSPPQLDRMPYGGFQGMAAYLRECTSPDDRVYASWFIPELYFYAQRGFAAGLVVTFGGHWSEPRYEQRIVSTFARQSVPIVIIETRSYGLFKDFYSSFDRHLQAHYRVAGETDFGDPDAGPKGYRVLVRTDRVPQGTHVASGMPCFNQGPG